MSTNKNIKLHFFEYKTWVNTFGIKMKIAICRHSEKSLLKIKRNYLYWKCVGNKPSIMYDSIKLAIHVLWNTCKRVVRKLRRHRLYLNKYMKWNKTVFISIINIHVEIRMWNLIPIFKPCNDLLANVMKWGAGHRAVHQFSWCFLDVVILNFLVL